MKKIKLNRGNQLDAITELLVKIYAEQRATSKVLIELIAKNDQDIIDAYADLNLYIQKEDEAIRDFVYAHFGELDLNALTKSEENE
jgi:hypothetical protein